MKKILAVVLSVILVAGLAIGGITWKKNSSSGPVNVYSVMDLSTTYWGDENESSGMVTTDQIQNVYLSSTQTVKEILVSQGQEVKKGDVLMTYDTTLSEVELLKKDLAIQQMELDLKKAKERLAKISKYRPGVPVKEKDMVMSLDLPMNMTLMAGGWRMIPGLLTGGLTGGEGEPATEAPSTEAPTTEAPTTEAPTTEAPTTEAPTTEAPTTEAPSTEEPSTEAPSTEQPSTQEPTKEEPTTPSETETTAPEEDPKPEIVYPKLIGGRGTDKVPYVFNWNSQWTFDQALLAYLSQGRKDAYAILKLNVPEETTEDSKPAEATGEEAPVEEESWWKIEIHRDTLNTYTFEMLELCANGQVVPVVKPETPDVPVEPIPEPMPDPYFPVDPGVSYTAAEIADMMSEAQDAVRDLDLDIRMAKTEYEKMQKELNNGEVVAELDGTVTVVRDEESAKIDAQSLIDVSGGGGYYVNGTVSELGLEGIQVGTPVTVMSWESYESYEGTVCEISEYPLSGNSGWYYNGVGNSNVSYYSFKVFIDESANLKEYEYVSLRYTDENVGGEHFYLENSMIRSENGQSYVYVAGEGDKLERRNIRTGKSLWGYYTEIISGLTQEDSVAFPYGKAVKEGAPAVFAETSELYSYY